MLRAANKHTQSPSLVTLFTTPLFQLVIPFTAPHSTCQGLCEPTHYCRELELSPHPDSSSTTPPASRRSTKPRPGHCAANSNPFNLTYHLSLRLPQCVSFPLPPSHV